jgi:hypothetical protein
MDFVCEERGMVRFEVKASSGNFDYSLCSLPLSLFESMAQQFMLPNTIEESK